MAESLGERTEPATPRWLGQRRLLGDVARSADLVTAIVLLTASLVLAVYGATVTRRLVSGLSGALRGCGAVPLRTEELAERLRSTLGEALGALLPLFAALVVMSIAASLMQTGLLFVPGLVKPRLDRLSPAARICNLFSASHVTSFGITLIKVAAIVALAAGALLWHWPALRWLGERSVAQIAAYAASAMISVANAIGLVLCLVGVLDFANERWRRNQSLRMSPAQRRDEQRETEGPPLLRRRRRRLLQRSMAQDQMG